MTEIKRTQEKITEKEEIIEQVFEVAKKLQAKQSPRG